MLCSSARAAVSLYNTAGEGVGSITEEGAGVEGVGERVCSVTEERAGVEGVVRG